MLRQLILLSLCVSACTTIKSACDSYRSPAFKDVAWQCSGMRVDHVPRLLPRSLQMLRLVGTAISSLDNNSFRDGNLPELKILVLTRGGLTSVGAQAFCALPALTHLYLDSNRLDFLDALSLSCNQFLRTVSLVDNQSLRQLPRLVSTSVENLYLDYTNLASVDPATVEGMTALKVLSLIGNRNLHCPSLETQFKQARPDLMVMCNDPVDLPSSVSHDDQEKSLNGSDSTLNNTEKDSTVDEQRTSEIAHNGSYLTIKNKNKDPTANVASRIPLSVAAIVFISVVISISV